MKITIAAGGRFWFFELAQQLLKRGHLNLLLASQPKFMTRRWGIPSDKVRTILLGEILARGWRKAPWRRMWNPDPLIHEIFDRTAAFHTAEGNPDIFDGLASFSLHSLRAAKRAGAVTVVTRGSSHIAYQVEVLQQEYEKFGVSLYPSHPADTAKDLQEYAEADYISVPSSFAKRTFVERGVPAAKLIVVPYGVDLASFQELPKTDNVFRVVFTGGMSLRKGVHYLLQAFAELKLRNAELMLIGTLNEEILPFFKKYEGHYRHLGHIPQNELHGYYSQASVFVLPSIEDGFGQVLIQAMACGLPIVASENTGGPDLARNGKEGFIVPIRDVNALKEKILYLYEHPEARAQMGAAAKERVTRGFTWDDYGERMVREYARILQQT